MKRFSFRIFGIEVFTLEVVGLELVTEEDPEDESTHGGGSSHNFERDPDPIDPANRDPWEYESRVSLGFSAP